MDSKTDYDDSMSRHNGYPAHPGWFRQGKFWQRWSGSQGVNGTDESCKDKCKNSVQEPNKKA